MPELFFELPLRTSFLVSGKHVVELEGAVEQLLALPERRGQIALIQRGQGPEHPRLFVYEDLREFAAFVEAEVRVEMDNGNELRLADKRGTMVGGGTILENYAEVVALVLQEGAPRILGETIRDYKVHVLLKLISTQILSSIGLSLTRMPY